jgi:hypothetical protein
MVMVTVVMVTVVIVVMMIVTMIVRAGENVALQKMHAAISRRFDSVHKDFND